MGHTIAEIKIYNPYKTQLSIKLKLLVDTGSTYTWIRESRLKKLKIKPIDERRFRTVEK